MNSSNASARLRSSYEGDENIDPYAFQANSPEYRSPRNSTPNTSKSRIDMSKCDKPSCNDTVTQCERRLRALNKVEWSETMKDELHSSLLHMCPVRMR